MCAATDEEKDNNTHRFILLHSPSSKQDLRCMAWMVLTLAIVRIQPLLLIRSHYWGGFVGDAGLYSWLLKSHARDLFTRPWFNTTAFYPYTQSLAWSDNFILPGLIAVPLQYVGSSPILTFNLIIAVATLLNGFCTYRLCFRLTGNPLTSTVAGASFLSLSYFSSNLGHPQLQFAFWIPLSVSLLFSYFADPKLLSAVLFGFTIVLTFLTTVYFSLFILLAALLLWLSIVVQKPRHFQWREYALFLGGATLGISPILLFLSPYLAVRETFGARALYEAHYFSATALSYLSTSPFNLLYRPTASLSHEEGHLGSGVLLLACTLLAFMRVSDALLLQRFRRGILALLTVCAILSLNFWHTFGWLPVQLPNILCAISMWLCVGGALALLYNLGTLERKLGFHILTNRGLMASFFFCALVFFLLSLGPQGNPEKGHYALGLFRLCYVLMPGFDSIRAISRSGVVVLFCSVVLTAFILSHYQKKLRWSPALLGIITLAIVLENFNFALPLEQEQVAPPIFEHLAQMPDRERALLILPMGEVAPDGTIKSWGEFARLNTLYMHWAFPLARPMVNGYSGQRSKLMRELPAAVANFPDERSLQAISSVAGLRYIVYASRFNPNFELESFSSRIQAFASSVQYLQGDSEGNFLFELIGSQTLDNPDFYLLVPSYPAVTIRLELSSLYDSKQEGVTVDVLAPDQVPGVPLASLDLLSDGEWRSFEVRLPQTNERVRPVKLTFAVHSARQQRVLMRRAKVLP